MGSPELGLRRDETMTAEQEAQLASLRTSWRVDGVLRRAEFDTMSAATQRSFIQEDLLGTTVKKMEDDGSITEAATGATAGRGSTTSQDAAETDSAER